MRLAAALVLVLLLHGGGAAPPGRGSRTGLRRPDERRRVTLTTWQIGLGLLAAGLAGAGIHAALRPAASGPASASQATLALHDPRLAMAAGAAALPATDPAMLAPLGMLGDGASSTPPVPESEPGLDGARAHAEGAAPGPSAWSEPKLLENARALLHDGKPGRALALLARVTAPELVGERDRLRKVALAERAEAASSASGASGSR